MAQLAVWLNSPVRSSCSSSGGRRKRKGFVIRNLHLVALAALTLLTSTLAFGKPHLLNSGVAALFGSVGPPGATSQDSALLAEPLSTKDAATPAAPAQAGLRGATAAQKESQLPTARRNQLPIDWQKTELGPGYPAIIDSAWCDIGVLRIGSILRIEANGFNSHNHANAAWGWYLNVWSGDARHWTTHPDASRLLHLNPRPRAGYIAMNHCLRGGWGPEKDVPVPAAWAMENAGSPFVLELTLGPEAWSMKLNGDPMPKMTYNRQGDFSQPLTLQLYDALNPRVFLESPRL